CLRTPQPPPTYRSPGVPRALVRPSSGGYRCAISHGGERMSVEKNKQIYRHLVEEVWNRGQVERITEYVAGDHRRNDPTGTLHGRTAALQALQTFLTALSDLRYEVHDLIGEGDLLSARWTMSGFHTGALLDIPATGRYLELPGMSFNRLV